MSKSNFFHAHLHTRYSPLDGMPAPERCVQIAHDDGQPAIAMTDHGLMGGVVSGYKAASALGMKFFPGVEGYLIDPYFDGELEDSGKAGRYHLGLLALSEKGYKGLVKFVSMTHTRPRFSRFPRFTLPDLAEFGQEYGKHIALTTGCYFGWAQQSMVNSGADEAEKVVRSYASWFPNTFVEVQHHNIQHENELGDDQMVREMMKVAKTLGLPVIATQDSHYATKEEKKAHALMKRMVYGGVEDEFPGDSFHVATTKWVRKHYTDKQWDRIEEGLGALYDLNKLKIKPLDKFVVDVPGDWKDPHAVLVKRVMKSHKAHMKAIGAKGKLLRTYEAERDEQLRVIEHLGMAAYFLICDMFVRFCKRKKIAIEARGSANGSYICYLLGIHQIDPIADGCMSERFLSDDRIKPPDVDIDIEDGRRWEALQWFFDNWESVQIGTWGALGITVDKETGEERGSVFATWIQGQRRMCIEEAWGEEVKRAERCERGKCKCGPKCFGKKPVKYRAEDNGKELFRKRFGNMQGLPDVKRYNRAEYEALRQIHEMKTVHKSYGVHAGGVLMSGNKVKIDDYIPTMLIASSNTRATQYDMDAVEEFGLLKMDILGQTSLSVMRICQELMGREDPTDFSWIPRDDKEALKLLRDGRQNTGIFHFEGYTKSKGGRELGVKSVKDAILVQALYMPGCMDIAPGQVISMKDLYLRRRKYPSEREHIEYLHPVFEKHLAPTYGCVVFQEQVISIMRDLGMSIASVNKFFKVVKDSGKGAIERNQQRMAEVRSEFDKLCKKNGIDSDEAWAATASFVAYGFNRNHATGYGLRSYRTAYLKAHHQLEYMTALLIAWAGRDKEKVYLREARRLEIPIRPPDVNQPSFTWSMDKKRGAIRKGLVSVAGIGDKTAQEIADKGPYVDLKDFVHKVNGRIITGAAACREGNWEEGLNKGIMAKLNQAGVLESLK